MTVSDSDEWHHGPERPRLEPDAVHVWRAGLVVDPIRLRELCACLAPDEQARVGRYRFPGDAARYAAGRGVLRHLLASYLAVDPAGVGFDYGAYGKPALAVPSGSGLEFNVSHAGAVLLVAVARGRAVGVDVEFDRPTFDPELAARYFSPLEVAALRSIAPGERRPAFLACWTRKEAYIKARGRGLSLPLEQFDVTLRPGEPARLLADRGDPDAVTRWRLVSLPMPPGYAAALVAAGRQWRLCLWNLR